MVGFRVSSYYCISVIPDATNNWFAVKMDFIALLVLTYTDFRFSPDITDDVTDFRYSTLARNNKLTKKQLKTPLSAIITYRYTLRQKNSCSLCID